MLVTVNVTRANPSKRLRPARAAALRACPSIRLQQQGIAAFTHQRVKRYHGAQTERPGPQEALPCANIRSLVLKAFSSAPALVVVDPECSAVQHRRPLAEHPGNALMGC
jgi:xanthine/CO dehydrogenase XdhC/CoxF family maturation factor